MSPSRHRLALALAVCLAGGALGCRKLATRATAEEAVLASRLAGLEKLLERAQKGPLLPPGDITVVIDQALLQELLSRAVPYERVIRDRYRIRITSATILFEDGAEIVRLGGRASLASRPEEQGYAEIAAVGALDVIDLDHETGTLRARVKLVAFDVLELKVLGVDTALAQLVEDLAREQLDTLSVLANPVEIPVRLQDRVPIPGLGPKGGVQIDPALVDLRLAVVGFSALRGRLWVSIGAQAGGASPAAP